jgi:hypothetical protein
MAPQRPPSALPGIVSMRSHSIMRVVYLCFAAYFLSLTAYFLAQATGLAR